MPERRRFRHNPYQLPFNFDATSVSIGQHVRVLHEPHMVRHPADAALYLLNQVFVPFEQFRQEQLYVLLLDNKNLITHDVMVYKGTVNTVHIRTAELFMEAVKANAPSIIYVRWNIKIKRCTLQDYRESLDHQGKERS